MYITEGEMIELTHREACIRAAKFLRSKLRTGISHKFSVCELERCGECPDAFAFGSSFTELIEVKVSRSDFLQDKNKIYRRYPERGLGQLRSYMCPTGLIKENELPLNWGLFYINEKGKIEEIKRAKLQKSNHVEEIVLISSIMIREGIKPQCFSYKKYKKRYNIKENRNKRYAASSI